MDKQEVGRPILLGQAEVIEIIPDEIRDMIENEGFYVGTDPSDPSKGEAPLLSMGGKIYSMVIDNELDPHRFIDGTKFVGPLRGHAPS